MSAENKTVPFWQVPICYSPPRRANRVRTERRVACRIQKSRNGGIDGRPEASTCRLLARLAPEINSGQSFEKERQTMRKNILKFLLGFVVGLVLMYIGYQVFG